MTQDDSKPKRILITGNNGYIGSVMGPWFKRAGFDVVGLDTNLFQQCSLVPDKDNIPTVEKDLREVTPRDLEGFDAVVHLAALSNDPIGNLREDWTRDINHTGSVRLAKCAKQAGVKRFVFSSSCIMYGMSEVAEANEDAPLAPQTEYARSKVTAEAALSELADDDFSPVFCRNGTVYGLSPRMRFDTVLNNLMGMAVSAGRVQVFSDGTPWRPVVHVQDVARSFQAILEAPRADIHDQAFNMGADHLNHQISDLARIVTETVPGCALEMVPQPGADQRTYKAGFGKFKRTFPAFQFMWTPRDGARELYEAFTAIGLTAADFKDKRFTRLHWLRHLIDSGQVDGQLRWAAMAA
jgi:nucleoside-diphosphate-sugar epimerase